MPNIKMFEKKTIVCGGDLIVTISQRSTTGSWAHVQHKEEFFKQCDRIATGDNHSVSPVNITECYVIRRIRTNLKPNNMFKRFIDDIIWLSCGFSNANNITKNYWKIHENNSLELVYLYQSKRQIQIHSLNFFT